MLKLNQNYWPGFLDILVNVMLYLILLVGTFALGAVALSIHSMEQRSQLDILGSEVESVVENLIVDEDVKAKVRQNLDSLNLQQMQQRRVELERDRALIDELREEYLSQLALLDELEMTNESFITDHLLNSEKNVEESLLAVEDEIEALRAQYETFSQETIIDLSHISDQGSSIYEFKIGVINDQSSNSRINDLVLTLVQGEIVSNWVFDADQLIWPVDKILPIAGVNLDDSRHWRLITFADVDNPRVAREAFSRMTSVRQILIQQGVPQVNIELDLRDIDEFSNLNEVDARTVVLVGL